jgi:parvulin-like peptidyl-prolyl isomerase
MLPLFLPSRTPMAVSIQLGNHTISAAELPHLLAGYRMLPHILREITIDRAITGVELGADEKAAAIKEFYTKNQISTPEDITSTLQQFCITIAQLEAIATRELKLEKFKITTWGNKLEQYFLQYKPQLDKVLYSLLRVTDMEVAQELYFRIKAGEESFADCALEYSQGQEAQTGGLLGPVPISQPHQAIAQKLSISQVGQLWPPMKLDNWVVIVRLEKLIPAQLDDAMKANLLNHLFEQWLASEINNAQLSICEEDGVRDGETGGNNFPSVGDNTFLNLPSEESPILVMR